MVSEDGEVREPRPVALRVAGALSHDVLSPLRMMRPLLDLPTTTQERLRLVANAVDEVTRVLETLVGVLRLDVRPEGTTAGADVERYVREAAGQLGDETVAVDVVAGEVPLPPELAAVVVRDLLAHALASGDATRVRLEVRPDGPGVAVTCHDDGTPPTVGLGDLRHVAGSSGLGLLAAQRVVAARGGMIDYHVLPDGVRVTLRTGGDRDG